MKRPAGYDAFIKSAQWRNICAVKKKQAENKCERCGKMFGRLEVHHLNYERFGGRERLSDLLVVCAPCHEKEEVKRQEELKIKARKARNNARFRGFIIKLHDEDYWLTEVPTEEDYEAFESFMEKINEED